MPSAPKPSGESRQPPGAADQPVGEAPGRQAVEADALSPDSGTTGPDPGESDSAAAVDADLDALLADVRRERDEYLEIAQRARADFENYRKRAGREAQE